MIPLSRQYQHLLEQEAHNGAQKDGSKEADLGTRPAVTFMSSVMEEGITSANVFSPEYWISNLVSPVKFSTGLSRLLANTPDINILLEIGPHSALAGPIRQITSTLSGSWTYITSQKRKQDSNIAFLSSLGKLYQEGVSMDLKPLFSGAKAIAGLPTYPWDHSNVPALYESRLTKVWRERKFPAHCLLGVRTEESTEAAPRWRNILHLDEVAWLSHHRIAGTIVFPFAGYVSMAGEAVRQIADATRGSGYRCRNVFAKTALIMKSNEARPIEVITTLSKKPQIDSTTSGWFEFVIESHNGTSWTEHCRGDVQHIGAAADVVTSDVSTEYYPRTLSKSRFYASMKNMGYGYTDAFAILDDIRCSTTMKLARATIKPPEHNTQTSPFTIHPAIIDGCLQLHLCTLKQGLLQQLQGLLVPQGVQDILVCPTGNNHTEMSAFAEVTKDEKDLTSDCVELRDGTDVLARIRGIHLVAVEDDGDATGDIQSSHAAALVQWLPAFDFTNTSRLIRAPPSDRESVGILQEMTFLCILESLAKIKPLEPEQTHFQKFKHWMQATVDEARAGKLTLLSHPDRFIEMPSSERQKIVNQHLQTLQDTPWNAAAIGVHRLAREAKEVIMGSSDALDMLAQDQVLTRIYDATAFDYGAFVRCLSHSRPNLRILEVGAGTGGTTDLIVKSLSSGSFSGDLELPSFDLYTFTDISAGFFPAAKERFPHVHNMEYKVFDITKHPGEQGFEDASIGSYDLIIATQVVHATAEIEVSLQNIRSLLKKNGILLLAEPDPSLLMASFIFGHLPGWWYAKESFRRNGPLMDVTRWDQLLKSSGFTGAEQVVFDIDPPFQRGFAIIAKPSADACDVASARSHTISFVNELALSGSKLWSHLTENGWGMTPLELGFPPVAPSTDLILQVLTRPPDVTAQESAQSSFDSIQRMFRYITSEHKVVWVLPRVQMMCADPIGAHSLGIARAVRSELSLQLYTIEIDIDEPHFSDIIQKLLENILESTDTVKLAQDMEFVVNDGEIYLGRYHPAPHVPALKEAGGLQTTSSNETDRRITNGSLGAEVDDVSVVQQPDTASRTLSHLQRLVCDPEATYMIVGGTRGLGRSVATFLVERGARHLLLFSRSTGKDYESKSFMQELQSMDCSVSAVAGSVTNMSDVQRAIQTAVRPIKGVFQLSMVLHDKVFTEMSWTEWAETMDPKVVGTWNLHDALLNHKLDIFWMASSVNTVFDMPGQANYQAANIFMQAFCQYRHSLGMPASVLDVAPINDVGYVSITAEAEKQIQGSGLVLQSEKEFLECLEMNILAGGPRRLSKRGKAQSHGQLLDPWVNVAHLTMGVKSKLHLDDPRCTTSWRRNPKMGFYHNIKQETTSVNAGSDNTLATVLAKAAGSEGKAFLAETSTSTTLAIEIGRKISDLMLRPEDEVDIGQSLVEMGLDSLMAIELRRWFRSVMGIQLTVLEIVAAASLLQLGEITATRLLSQLQA